LSGSTENRCSNSPTGNIVYNGRCYVKYENENLTWFRARERCIDNSGDLAQFQTTDWTPPFNTSWLNKALTYWIGIRWNGWSWKSSGTSQSNAFIHFGVRAHVCTVHQHILVHVHVGLSMHSVPVPSFD